MARGKRNKRGKRHIPRYTPEKLRAAWDAIQAAPEGHVPELTINGRKIESADQLIAEHAKDPRKVDRQLHQQLQSFERYADRRAAEADREIKTMRADVANRRERIAALERINRDLDLGSLSPEQKAKLADLPDETIQAVEALVRLQLRREKRGQDPGVKEGEIAALTGLEEAEVGRLLRLAHDAGLVNAQGTALDIGSRPEAQKRQAHAIGIKAPGPDDFDMKGSGLMALPTPTLVHFGRIAQDEGLPLAPGEDLLDSLAALGRHLVVDTEVRQTPQGRHYVRATMLVVARGELADVPEAGRFAKAPLAAAVHALAQDDIPEALQDIRKEWEEAGWITQTENGWEWQLTAKEIQRRLDTWEGQDLGACQELDVDLPLRQFGLLVEAGRNRVPVDGGEDMPIHAGARSFEGIWQRQTRYTDLLHKAEGEMERVARDADEHEEIGEKLTRQSTFWRSHHVAASGILAHMREAKTVAVDLDVSEGLPDWENPEEAWSYAADAQLPFPVTYFDFTTPGGYRPKVAIKSQNGERIITLRAALCWTMEDHLAIAPFAWIEDEDLPSPDPTDLPRRSDYDSPGALHFGRKLDLLGPDSKPLPDEEIDFVTHLRITSDAGISAPAQVVRTEPIYGQPGWVDLMNNQDVYTGEDAEGMLLAETAITVAAACRVLSVIHALDGTVNIELAEGEPSRPERRAAERAIKKGRRAEISKTVRIHPTRQTESIPSDKPGKREYSYAHYRRGHFAHYPIGTRMADRLAERDHTKLVDHPVKGLCRKIYRKPTIVGRIGPDGAEREPVAKSYVFQKEHEPRR